jgi:hypothetical protein
MAAVFAPSRAGDQRFCRWFARFQRTIASPRAVQAFLRASFEMDARPILPLIQVPTLVLHRRDFHVIPIANGRYLAEHIPDARLVELAGTDHRSARLPSGWSIALGESSTSPVGLSVPYRTPDTPPSQITAVAVMTTPNSNQGPSWRSRNSTTQPGCPALLGAAPRTVASGKVRPRTNDRLGWLAGAFHSSAQRPSPGRS